MLVGGEERVGRPRLIVAVILLVAFVLALALALLTADTPSAEAAEPPSAATAPAAAAGSGKIRATVRRTSHGIPHIVAPNFESLAYGYAQAFAADNICVIADSYVTVRGERSRFFGPNENYVFRGNGATVNNLNSDFFFTRINQTQRIEKLLAQAPPSGPRPEIREGVRGYMKGYNDYLAKTGVANIPDPTCRGQEWVRPVTEMDVYRRFYQLALLASGGVAIDGIGSAQPPTPPLTGSGPLSAAPVTAADFAPLKDKLPLGGIGSNAYGLGKEATDNGKGIVLGNPHFPWDGSERFYQAQLTIPGKLDVSGASLFGVPLILIGHTKNLAWSHTVSTGFRFTPFELKLVPGSPTTYLVDGKPEEMTFDEVTVQAKKADGSLEPRTRKLYSSRYGHVFTSLLGQPLFPWTPNMAHSLGDANAANFRYLNHFFETNLAQSVREYDAVHRRNQGIPWVNSIAADSKGEAYYADLAVVPHVTDAKAADCNTPLGRGTFQLLRLPVLDGSRSECDWGRDPDAIQPGTFGPASLPSIFRNDYVTNSNDSYWLSQPRSPLEGFPRIIGDERTARALRTRSGLVMVEERLAAPGGARGFTLRQVQDAVFANRQYAGELFRDELVALCKANPVLPGTNGPVDVSEACPILETWDLRDDLDSRGAVLFRRFAGRALAVQGGPYRVPFSAGDPVNTPRGLNTESPDVRRAFADSVKELRDLGIPLDARLREYQFEKRGEEKIPIHGGPGTLSIFNAINVSFAGREGYTNVPHGSSFVMATQFTDGCPESRSILTYSQSASPESPYFADQTRMFSRKEWVDMLFCEKDILADPELKVTNIGGGFNPSGRRGRRLRLRVTPTSARVGERTRFVFRVTRLKAGKRVRVHRAKVRLGRRVATTNRHGRAVIVTRFKRRASFRPRATRSGFLPVRLSAPLRVR